MITHFLCLIFVCMLPLKTSSSVTSGLNDNLTNGTPATLYPHQQTTQLDLDTSPSTIADVKPQVATTQTTTPQRFTVNTQISHTSHDSGSSEGTTVVKSAAMTMQTFTITEATNTTKPLTVSPPAGSYSQPQSTVKISPSGVSRGEIPTTQLISAVTPTITSEDKNTSTLPVTESNATRFSTTSSKPTIEITKANEKHNSKYGNKHSKIVAGLIGGALLLMIVGFLAIYIQKKSFQNEQTTTTDWAGPSPFLSGGQNNGRFTLRSFNQISLSSFLPQRLSRRLSLLPEMDEELQNMTQTTTFERKHPRNTFGQEVDEKEPQPNSRPPAVTQENGKTNNVPQSSECNAAELRQDGSVQHSSCVIENENA